MDFRDLRKHWDELGHRDPLWAVLSEESRRGGRWDPLEFFRTGRAEVGSLVATLDRLAVPRARQRALDFGCGVGRLTQAFGEHFEHCTGVDISAAMIREAERYNRLGLRCRYVLNERPDLRRFRDGSFDLVYSGLVLQHMIPALARGYIREFVRVAAPGGMVVFQLPSHRIAADDDASLPQQACRARIEIVGPLSELRAGSTAALRLRVTNAGELAWPALQEHRFRLAVGNHWREAGGRMLQLDDGRTTIRGVLEPGASIDVDLEVRAPDAAGSFVLELDLVQEHVTWFQAAGSSTLRVPVTVVAAERPAIEQPLEPAETGGEIAAAGGGRPAARGLRGAWRLLAADLRCRVRRRESTESPRMEMHGIPREEVEGLIRECRGRLLAVQDEFSAHGWVGYLYFVEHP